MAGFTVTTRGLAERDTQISTAQLPPPVANRTVLLDQYYDNPIYANKTAAIQAAVDAAVAQRAVLECQALRVYQLDTGPVLFRRNSPLIVEGHGATWRANYAGGCQIINFTRQADYDTFSNVDVRDLTLDANSQTSVSGTHAVVAASSSQRLNFQHIYFRRCNWINVPVSGILSPLYVNFALVSTHLGGAETQTNLIDIRLEQCRMAGGDQGASVVGSCSTLTAVNVYLDQIYLDVQHDTGVTPTAGGGGLNAQVGGLGWGDYCEVRCIGANSADVGVEIDGMQEAHIWGRITDSWNAEYFARNFNSPRDLASQRYIYHGCQARVVNLLTSSTTSISAGFQLDATSTPNPGFGEAVLEDCSYLSLSATPEANGSAINVPNGTTGPRRLTIVGTFDVSFPNINDAPGSSKTPQPIFIAPSTTAGFFLKGGRIRILLAGTGGANYLPRMMTITPPSGCTVTVDLDALIFASSLAGVSAGNTRGLNLGLSSPSGGSIRGRIKYIGWESFSGGDTTPALTNISASSFIAIDGALIFDQVDLRRDPAASPAIIGISDATNKAKVYVRSATPPTFPIPSASVGSTNFAAASFTSATGNQYLGLLPAEIQFATGTGAGITAIDASKDGTTYENVYTQASGALAQSVIVPVENGDFVKVTFATTQPTGRVRFRRAQ